MELLLCRPCGDLQDVPLVQDPVQYPGLCLKSCHGLELFMGLWQLPLHDWNG